MTGLLSDLYWILKPVRKRALGVVALFFCLAIFDLIGVGLVVPFFTVMLSPDGSAGPLASGVLETLGITPGSFSFWLALGIVAAFALKSVGAIFAQWTILGFVMMFRAELTKSLMSGYLRMPYAFFLDRSAAELVQTIVVNLRIVTDDLLLPLFRTISEAIVSILLLAFLISIAPGTFAILIVLMGVLGGVFVLFARPRLKGTGAQAIDASEDLIESVGQGMGAIKESKVLGVERGFLLAVSTAAYRLARAVRVFYTLSVAPKYLMEFTVVSFVISLIMVHVASGGSAEDLIPIFAAFGMAGLRLIPAASQIFATLNAMNYARPALERLVKDMRDIEAALEGENLRDQVDFPPVKFVQPPDIGAIELQDLSFHYGQGKNTYHFGPTSLTVRKGEVLGIIGPSGSGKSTMVDLILGLLHPTGGKVVVTDADQRASSAADRKALFAYIPQQDVILNDTIEKNITLDWDHQGFDDAEMQRALQLSQFQSVVDRLDGGLQTVCGEAGKLLSGGERQRLAIARALYHRRKVLVMDEVTSALDPITERELLRSFQNLKEAGLTIFMITHRPETLKLCDKVVRVTNGQIEEMSVDDARRAITADAH